MLTMRETFVEIVLQCLHSCVRMHVHMYAHAFTYVQSCALLRGGQAKRSPCFCMYVYLSQMNFLCNIHTWL